MRPPAQSHRLDTHLGRPWDGSRFGQRPPLQRFSAERARIWQALGMDPNAMDWNRLEALRPLQRPGKPDVVQQMVQVYLKNADALMQSLNAALVHQDRESMTRAAHSLKSTAATIGATGLSNLAADMEAKFRNGQFDLAANLILRCQASHDAACRALNERYPEAASQ